MGSLAVMREHLAEVRATMAGLSPTALSGPDAAAMVRLGVDLERLGASVRTRYAKRVADTRAFERTGHRDAASWLAGVSGESTGAAKGTLELAEKLVAAPLVEEAFSDGQLSAAQAKVVAGAGSLDPSAQGRLIDKAKKASYRELREESQRVKRQALGEQSELAKERRAHERRFLRIWTTEDGGVRISGRLTRLDRARVQSVLEAEKQAVFKEARRAGRRTADEAYLADAFVGVICGDGTVDRAKAQVHLRADMAALDRGSVQGDEVCEITGIGSVPVAVARDLFGDSLIELVLRDGTDVRTITSRKRTIPGRLRAGMADRGRHCAVPGCPNTRYLQIDHDWDFAKGGPTALQNLQYLCAPHHKLKTLYGFRLVRGPDAEKQWLGPAERAGPGGRGSG